MGEANNVFISWSGERSKHAAKFLRKWLRNVIHNARPWMSEKDIKSGSVSVNSIRTALASAKVGIVCLTPENLKEPWLNFEAGGLLRTPEAETRVCTYLLDGLKPGQLEYPLAMFQARIADWEQTLALVQDINKYLDENPLTEAEMKEAFDKWWDDLRTVLETLPPLTTATPPARDPVAMTAEILDHLRAMRPEVQEISHETMFIREKREQDAALHEWILQHPGGVILNTAPGSVSGFAPGTTFGGLPPFREVSPSGATVVTSFSTDNAPAQPPGQPSPSGKRMHVPSRKRRK